MRAAEGQQTACVKQDGKIRGGKELHSGVQPQGKLRLLKEALKLLHAALELQGGKADGSIRCIEVRRKRNLGHAALHGDARHRKAFLLGSRAVVYSGEHVAMQVDHVASMARMASALTSSGVWKLGTNA